MCYLNEVFKIGGTYDTCHFVIPAKAGIQFVISFRVADKAIFDVLSHCVGLLPIIWIPAFAGMTTTENVCAMNYGKINRS
jgi:hypothetical protein